MHCDRGPDLGTGKGGFIDKAMGEALCARLQGEGSRGSPGGVETGQRADQKGLTRGCGKTQEANALGERQLSKQVLRLARAGWHFVWS